MPYLPLRIPPGVSRNGTLYQQKGRWYSANLVRWSEGVMQPIGGWTRISGKPALVDAVIADDGGVFTDYTDEANSTAAADVTLFPATPAIDDAFYFGMESSFASFYIDISTANTGGTLVWEYYNGSSWASVSVTDGTSDLTVDGAISFTKPSDWAVTTINSQGPFYFIRCRATAAPTTVVATRLYHTGTMDIQVTNPVRGVFGWRDDSYGVNLLYGTYNKVFHLAASQETDLTPSDLTTGQASASSVSGDYDKGAYDVGLYGSGDEAAAALVEATSWQFDNYGQVPIALCYSDGRILDWDLNVANDFVAVTNAPTSCVGVVVTPERMIVALGAGGDGRYLKWCDQDDRTVWTPASTNTAGDYYLPGQGSLMCGKRLPTETLIMTDTDAFALRYIGGTLIYRLDQVGTNCGVISRLGLTTAEGRAFWMGKRSFFMYEGGFAKALPCPVSDDIFDNLVDSQRSKVSAWANSRFHEVWFAYPGQNSGGECNKVVCYNYMENHWSGPWNLKRTSGMDAGAYSYMWAADPSGHLYNHETGISYLDTDGSTALVPSAASGPFELGKGDQVMTVRRYIPDEATLGDVDVTIYASLYPHETQTGEQNAQGANEDSQSVTIGALSDVRLTGRQIRLGITQDQTEWTFGEPRLEVITRGRR